MKSAKVKNISLEYPRVDGAFFVRKLSTDGQAAITDLDGNLTTYPIAKIKYIISAGKGILLESLSLGEQPFEVDKYLAGLERKTKLAELSQQAAIKSITIGG